MKLKLRQQLQLIFKQRFQLWLDRRQPATSELKLRQHLLFVFPSFYGGWFLLLIALLYLFGTNYQNNLILLCAYLLLSLFCCCILAAFFNLYKLELSTTTVPFCYAGDPVLVSFRLKQYQHKKMLQLSSEDFAPILLEHLTELLHLELYPKRRGYYQLQRFTLCSYYPFGLVRCWTHIQMLQPYWVYPVASTFNQIRARSSEQLSDQPDQLAPYSPGSPATALDWKRLAKTPWQPVVRQHSTANSVPRPTHLVVNTTGPALEQQVSEFCALIQLLESQCQYYSLSTAKIQIAADRGQAHLHRCLQALALC